MLDINHPDYSDFRELICYERPAAVLLHFYYGHPHLRLLLLDRFAFHWDPNSQDLKESSNLLARYLFDTGVVREMQFQVKHRAELMQFLQELKNSDANAFLLPYFSKIGTTTLVSTWMLEKDAKNFFLTSLRGDNFYVRKEVLAEDLLEKLYVEDGQINYHELRATFDSLESNAESFRSFSIKHELVSRIAREALLQNREIIYGAKALKAAFEAKRGSFQEWKNLVDSGLDNALLVRFFWPIQYFYQPFLVGLNFALKTHAIAELAESTSFSESVILKIKKVHDLSANIANLAILFGKRPTELRFSQFIASFEGALDLFAEIEGQFFSRLKTIPLLIDIRGERSLGAPIGAPASEIGMLTVRLTPEELKSPSLCEWNIAGTYCIEEQLKACERDFRKKVGLPNASVLAFEKSRSKVAAREAWNKTLPIPVNFRLLTDSDKATPMTGLDFPFIMKPNSGFASAGVQLVHNQEEFESNFNLIKKMNRLVLQNYDTFSGILCEEFIDGDEIAIDSITADGETKIFGFFKRGFVSYDNFQDYIYLLDRDYYYDGSLLEIQAQLAEFFTTIGYTNGPAHSELRFCSKRARWILIETAFRIGAGGNLGLLVEKVLNVPYRKLSLLASSQKFSKHELRNIEAKPQLSGLFYVPKGGAGGRVQEITGEAFLKSNPAVFHWKYAKSKGEILRPYPIGPDYPGIVLAAAETTADLMHLAKDLDREVRVIYE